MKLVNNLATKKWAQLDYIYKEKYHNKNNNDSQDANFVIPVTSLNIICLLKNAG